MVFESASTTASFLAVLEDVAEQARCVIQIGLRPVLVRSVGTLKEAGANRDQAVVHPVGRVFGEKLRLPPITRHDNRFPAGGGVESSEPPAFRTTQRHIAVAPLMEG